jgi:hypothetical protein
MIYSLYTLVDITATGHYKSRNDLERLQQQNFDTVMQTISLAGNIYYKEQPQIITAEKFSRPDDRCWFFMWQMELDHLFEKNGDELHGLRELFNFVPFISDLTETAQFDRPLFKVNENIIFDFKK